MRNLLLCKLKNVSFNTSFFFTNGFMVILDLESKKQNVKYIEDKGTSLGRFLYFLGDFSTDYMQLNVFLKNVKWVLKGLNQNFFFEFKLVGLGYKVFKLKSNFEDKIICLRIGLSHRIKYCIPSNVGILLGKKRFFIYSSNLEVLRMVARHFFLLKRFNSYKEKGIIDIKQKLVLKKGKQQQH